MLLSVYCVIFLFLREWSGSLAAGFIDDDIYEDGVDVETINYRATHCTFDDTEGFTRLRHHSFRGRTINRRDLQDALKQLFGGRYAEITENQFTAIFTTTETYYKESDSTAFTHSVDDSERMGDLAKTVRRNDAADVSRYVYKKVVTTDQIQAPTRTQLHKYSRKMKRKQHRMDKGSRNKSETNKQYLKSLRPSRSSWYSFRKNIDKAEYSATNMNSDDVDSTAVADALTPIATSNYDPDIEFHANSATRSNDDDATKSDDNASTKYHDAAATRFGDNDFIKPDITNPLESITEYVTITDTVSWLGTTINQWKNMYMDMMKTKVLLDIPKLLDKIIANLTLDYDLNLMQRLNETVQDMSLPLCPTAPPPETTPTTTTESAPGTGSVWSKCFVCGLTDHEIPNNSWCGDAFSGDFLPLVPLDATGRGHIAQYRRYCKWRNIRNIWVNKSDPHSVYGRWTGGCAVRWIDLSSIYTQRTCRNKDRATTGRHFLSKRMAKLEMALRGIDNGCIISPVATLVPFSRGISLYARFHACVCTGNWCNQASISHPWIECIAVFTFCSLTVYLLWLS